MLPKTVFLTTNIKETLETQSISTRVNSNNLLE